MNKQQGIGLFSTIIILAILCALGWLIFTRMTNLRQDETPNEAIDRAKTNVDKANEASNKAKDAIDTTRNAIEDF